MDKATRYEWAKTGDMGRDRMIKVDILKVDHAYQREVVADNKILSIAREFQWTAFGKVIVMQRENGALFIVDGQQRVEAARRRGDISEVPCLVFKSDGKDHEAKAFLQLNTYRTSPSSLVKFFAASRANIDPEKSIHLWLSEYGMKVGNKGGNTVIDFPAVLKGTWLRDTRSAQRAILAQKSLLMSEESVSGEIHKGLFYLSHYGIELQHHIEKLRTAGKGAIRQSISHECRATQRRTERAIAIGILAVINKRCRNRVSLPEGGSHDVGVESTAP